ncbi:MAG TPA: F0F1 ATP synthase subunit B' [Xanthobacteraceae bacterium]
MANEIAHTEIPAGGPPFPPFDRETFPSQLLWLAVAFAALYVMMSRLALPRVDLILTKRRQHIAGDLCEAERLKGDSSIAIAAYEEELAQARIRAQALFSEFCQRQAAEEEAGRKALDVRLNRRIAEAEERIATAKAAAMSNIRGIATEATIAIVARLTGGAPSDRRTVSAAVGKALQG